jgi:hypothetical protein
VPAIPNSLPHRRDVTIQRGIPHKLVGPQMLQEFLLKDDPIPMRQQVREHLKRLGLQRHRLPSLVEFIALGVEEVVTKDIGHRYTFARRPQGYREASYHKNPMKNLRNLYAIFMLLDLTASIFPCQQGVR